jgi:Tol biopolymer transport system component
MMKNGDCTRRDFLKLGMAGLAGLTVQEKPGAAGESKEVSGKQILFRARGETPQKGRLGMIATDGSCERYLDFNVEDQVSWSYGPVFPDRKRMILMSVEGEKTWEHNVRSHIWIYDLDTEGLVEIARKDPPATYMPPCALLPGEERIIVNPVVEGEQRVFTMNLDGSDQCEVTHEGEGFSYGISLSPDAKRIALHTTGPHSYRIYVVNLDGSGRTLVVGNPGHLYFGPTWSPDGEWLLYLDCHDRTDPGHDWADICIGRPDGSEHRVVTEGQRHWFGTSYGGPETRGSGSNIPQWSPKESVCTYTRGLPDSRTAWPFQTDRPDTDHFNREYSPDLARGGTEICLLDPFSQKVTPLTTHALEARGLKSVWDFRSTWSPDGSQIAFCRSPVGCASELWVMDADGGNQRFLTRGKDGLGVDHPVWF